MEILRGAAREDSHQHHHVLLRHSVLESLIPIHAIGPISSEKFASKKTKFVQNETVGKKILGKNILKNFLKLFLMNLPKFNLL